MQITKWTALNAQLEFMYMLKMPLDPLDKLTRGWIDVFKIKKMKLHVQSNHIIFAKMIRFK